MTTIGVLSDTHGLLRPQALDALQGSDLIIHAGDVGKPDILDRLNRIAPVIAVRGNIDVGTTAARLPLTQRIQVREINLFVIHKLEDLDFDPAAENIDVVIFGHSHRPMNEIRNDVLYLNPGSAGPRRFSLPVTVARLTISNEQIHPELIDL